MFCLLQALDRRGQARLQLGKYKEALEDFESAKKADPKTANADKNIATAKQKMSEESKTEDKPAEEADNKAEEEAKAKAAEEEEAKKKTAEEEEAKKKAEEEEAKKKAEEEEAKKKAEEEEEAKKKAEEEERMQVWVCGGSESDEDGDGGVWRKG